MHEPYIYTSLTLDEYDLEFQLDTILSFLSATHPYLEDAVRKDTCVEIRPVLREGRNYLLSKSLVLWDLEDTSVDRLKKFLKLHNGVPACLFYSVYSFDNHKQILTKKGYKKGTIHTENAIFTNEIALDFDGITEKEQAQYNQILNNLDIYPFWVFTGHGYQAHLLLNEEIYEPDALLKFVSLFHSKGFPVDTVCKDAARLMRLPFTYNCKAFSEKEHAEREHPVLCEIEQYSDARYSISELFYKVNQLSTVCPEIEMINTDTTGSKENIKKEQKKAMESVPHSKTDSIDISNFDYPYIQNYTIPEPICKMLVHTPEGYRNLVLGFLIRYFKTRLRIPKQQIYEILSIWRQSACIPALNSFEFEDDFKRLYYTYSGLPYDAKLAREFGYIAFDQEIVLSKKEIAISNHFFYDFKNLSGKNVRMYLAIRLLEHVNLTATQEELSKLLGISTRAVRSTLQELVKTPHCYLIKGNAKRKIPNSYHSHRLYPEAAGYSIFTYNDLKCYITELFEDKKRGNNELKFYLYMQYRFRSGEIFMSQVKFGEALGLEQHSISEIADRLAKKQFLLIEKRPHKTIKQFEQCFYTLLR